MFNFKLYLILIVNLLGSTESVKVDCGLKEDPANQEFFEDLEDYLTPNGQICGFKIDGSKNSSEINFDFPVDGNTGDLTFIYTTTSIPILPAELFRKFSNKTLGCGFYKLPEAKIERDWFKHAGNLEHLFFRENQIPKLGGGKFVDLKKLQSLNLRANSIKEIDKDAFAGLENLRKLFLNSNQIDSLHPDLFRNMVVLEELYLSWNKIEKLDGNLFIGLKKMRILKLHKNKLQQLPLQIFKNLVALTDLSLGNNEIKEVDVHTFIGLGKLEDLSLCFNNLEHLLPGLFRDLSSLKELALCWNSIKELDENLFAGLKDLRELNLIGNQLKTLPEKLFDDLTSLEVLNLERNPIESLKEHLFKNNGNLEKLKLSGKISKMSNKMFSHLKKLRLLDLLGNVCISLEIRDHNSNIAFTEEILIPCSCKALKDGKPYVQIKTLFIFLGVIVAIILFVLVLILIKMMRQTNFRLRDIFLVLKNGEWTRELFSVDRGAFLIRVFQKKYTKLLMGHCKAPSGH
jgi:Leucine-rich repeat (LRR) protein